MSRITKLGLVLGGYVVACVVAAGVLYVYQLFTQDPSAQASARMYAFGDALLFMGVCGVLSLIPTGLGLYFLVRRLHAP